MRCKLSSRTINKLCQITIHLEYAVCAQNSSSSIIKPVFRTLRDFPQPTEPGSFRFLQIFRFRNHSHGFVGKFKCCVVFFTTSSGVIDLSLQVFLKYQI
jgi:hypothetical protein